MIQQNDIEKKYGSENTEIEYMLCNTCMISYVTKITKSLETMKNKKQHQIQIYDMDAIIENQNNKKRWNDALNDFFLNKKN